MFDLHTFCNQVPEHLVAGAYVCGKWPGEIRKHQEFIATIGFADFNEKLHLLNLVENKDMLWNIMKSWLMGRGVRLRSQNSFRNFMNEINHHQNQLSNLCNLSLLQYNPDIHREDLICIWNWAQEVVHNNSKLVAVSKLLHHILPNLIVPVDRQYTNKFFRYCNDFPRKSLNLYQFVGFEEAILFFQQIANSTNVFDIEHTMEHADTSATKTIDNWLIMWIDLNPNLCAD